MKRVCKILTNNRKLSTLNLKQCHENNNAKTILVHAPGVENLFGSLHSCGALFEKPVSLYKAREHHEKFRNSMKDQGVQVLTVRDVLSQNCEKDVRARVGLENLAMQVMRYKLDDDDHDEDEKEISRSFPLHEKHVTKDQAYYLSDEYKRECISAMGTHDLIDLILTGPQVLLKPSSINTPLRMKRINTRPLMNLIFTRDQQLVTNKGLVISRMGSPQRLMETKIMEHCFTTLGVNILGKIKEPGLIEGGDFFPGGADICYIGTGLRTNQYAVDTMLKNDWFGTRRVAVVEDKFDLSQQRMHLDTVFNICGDTCVTMLDTIIGDKSKIKRTVTEYTKDEKAGRYYISEKGIEFSEYIQKEGYNIIPVTNEQQEAYGLNYLNLGNGRLISVDESTARTMVSSKYFDGNIHVIDFNGMTAMYGSVHCCSQVLLRE